MGYNAWILRCRDEVEGHDVLRRLQQHQLASITMDLARAVQMLDDASVRPRNAIKFVRNYGHDGRRNERLQIKPYIGAHDTRDGSG